MPKVSLPEDEVNDTLDVDLLMTLEPLKLSDVDLDKVIQYHRNIRAQREAGKGRAKTTSTAPAPKGVAALLAKKIPGKTISRRGL